MKNEIWAYSAVMDPLITRLPIYECLESISPYVDGICIMDYSIYDNVDLSKYSKVRKHVKSVYPCFDDPFGACFTSALKLLPQDPEIIAFFVDIDEIYELKQGLTLQDIVQRYPLGSSGAGISFSLRNYYCSRNFTIGGPSSKGPTLFMNRLDLYHDMLAGMVQPLSSVRRVSAGYDLQDGVRVSDQNGNPMAQYKPISEEECVVHHLSHSDPLGKLVRSILQFAHTSTLDLPQFFPFDPRIRREAIELIYKKGKEDLDNETFELYGEPHPFDYEPNELVDSFFERVGIQEIDPRDYPRIVDGFTGNATL